MSETTVDERYDVIIVGGGPATRIFNKYLGEILGMFNPAGFVETLAQLVERGASLENVLTMHYSSHPELTPKTSKPYFVWASEPLMKTLARSGSFPAGRKLEEGA